ncbi:GntP family permease [Brevibacillus centrosporus]|uniref:GntP family permease n=1 Tax=Brevibacillus centrosporus TaxID=54910 RepID=UPI000F09DE0D|nr:GntP family permease [Brevibacillus centrosporus]MEC2129860.1 GntP family permease [Brevibacillus centrosporus]RNB71801.1 permease DsdX [Brevibacillus centrosporus]GED32031.1 permease [Brevibacillus centrosporus]
MPLVITLISIVLLLILITRFKVNPFVSLLLAAGFVGIASGMPLVKVVDSIKDGMGGTLGFIAIVLALGTMLGKMMAESGGAERIARTLINRFGEKNVHWAMMFVAFIVGIPVFFQVGFVLLIPLVFTITRQTGVSLVKIGIPLIAGLSIVHGIVPPHPAAMAAVDLFQADVGKTIMLSIIVALPSAIIAGPLYGTWISKRVQTSISPELSAQLSEPKDERDLPSFGITVFTVLLPVLLMLLATIADVNLPKEDMLREWADFIGNPITSLLIAVIISFWTLGFNRGFTKDDILKFTNDCLAPTATILLVIGAGGAFNKVLLNSGVGDYIAELATASAISPIFLGWLIAALIRVATGSATVSMMTAAGIVGPIALQIPGTSPELLVLATGAGSLILSHVNDSGFWLIKEYFNMSVQDTLKTWTVMETILSVVAIILIMALSLVV